jgi:hypothetical protein
MEVAAVVFGVNKLAREKDKIEREKRFPAGIGLIPANG